MQCRFFRIPAHGTGGFAEELNAFLRGHRVLNVEREFCPDSGGAYWAVCVEYLASAPGGAGPSGSSGGKDKIDYRDNNSPGNANNNIGFRPVRSPEDSPQWEHDSDPAVIPSAQSDPAWRNQNARPVPVGAVEAAPKAPWRAHGGEFFPDPPPT